MPTHIAMLRGINVSGQKIIRMEALRTSFEAMGFSRVRTYVQSGNVVFDAGKETVGNLQDKIEKQIASVFGFAVPVLLKSSTEMECIVRDNPFPKKSGIDDSKLHVTFLSKSAPEMTTEILAALAANQEQFHINNREIYLYCPNGYGTTKLSNGTIEKKLGVIATTRNWKSVNALLAMARA